MPEDAKIIYEPVPKLGRRVIDKAIAANDVDTLRIAALAASLYEDGKWAQETCIRLAVHEDPGVRSNAMTGFSHIVRINGKLDEDPVRPVIETCLGDEDNGVRGAAEDAKEDIQLFLKWKF
jgi:HEAT repeat protein